MGDRIRIIGGPWPERVGAVGRIVTPTAEEARFYPFARRGQDEAVVLLDDDPLAPPHGDPPWTCAMSRKHLEAIP